MDYGCRAVVQADWADNDGDSRFAHVRADPLGERPVPRFPGSVDAARSGRSGESHVEGGGSRDRAVDPPLRVHGARGIEGWQHNEEVDVTVAVVITTDDRAEQPQLIGVDKCHHLVHQL